MEPERPTDPEGCAWQVNLIRLQHEYAFAEKRVEAAHQTANAGLKSLAIINGGAIVGLFTFIGNYADANLLGLELEAVSLARGLALFTMGLVASLAAILFAYCAQDFSGGATRVAAHITYQEMRDGEELPRKPVEWLDRGVVIFSLLGVATAIASLVAFAWGAAEVFGALALAD